METGAIIIAHHIFTRLDTASWTEYNEVEPKTIKVITQGPFHEGLFLSVGDI